MNSGVLLLFCASTLVAAGGQIPTIPPSYTAHMTEHAGSFPNWTRSCQSTDTATEVLAGIDLSGKVYIYTGADGNLASQGTLALARANASLILTCRTAAKCEAVRSSIINQTGTTAPLEISLLDLSSKDSIRQFANRTIAKHAKIEGLINSAATYGTFMTHDHLVGAMEINLLGPALLTDTLLPVLRGGGRVVNVAMSTAMSFQSRARGFQRIVFVFLQCNPDSSSGGGSSSRGIFSGT